MDANCFCNMLHTLLNQNKNIISTVNFIDAETCFIIKCTDNSKFSLTIQDITTYYVNSLNGTINYRKQSIEDYTATHTEKDFLSDLSCLKKENPYVFQILIALMKLLELRIISHDTAKSIMLQVHSYEQKLKDDWNNLH